jgi:BirA family biotin operon repressor/biotin-[acetyl-CoA-carboxylase] ligase
MEMARLGDPGHLWITAGRQTAGRGRSGRNWASEPGNLFASLLLIDPGPPAKLANLAFVAALAACEALAGAARDAGKPLALTLKWPNDVMADERKIAGILLESASLQRKYAVIVGFGINCASHPPETRLPATDLHACGIAIQPDELFGLLASSFDGWLARWDAGNGFGDIRAQWLRLAAGIGSPIVARLPDREIRGTFTGIDEDGCLVLKTAGSRLQRIGAADIFFQNS